MRPALSQLVMDVPVVGEVSSAIWRAVSIAWPCPWVRKLRLSDGWSPACFFTHLAGLLSYCKDPAEWSPLSSCVSDHLALEAYTVYYATLYRVCQPTLAYPYRHRVIHPLLCFSLGFVCGLRFHISNKLPVGVDAVGSRTTFE